MNCSEEASLWRQKLVEWLPRAQRRSGMLRRITANAANEYRVLGGSEA